MNKEQLTFEQRCDILCQPVPPEALKPIGNMPKPNDDGTRSSKPWFSDINDAYIVSQFNAAFGKGNWTFKEVDSVNRFHDGGFFSVTITACLKFIEYPEVTIGPMSVSKYGQIKPSDGTYIKGSKPVDDLHKGCSTAVFGQLCKMMGIGNSVYAGCYSNYDKAYTKPMPKPYSLERIMSELEKADSLDAIKALYAKHVLYQNNPEWLEALGAKRKGLESKPASKAPAKKPSTIERALALIESATGTLSALDEVLQICADWIDDPAFIKAMQEARKKSS